MTDRRSAAARLRRALLGPVPGATGAAVLGAVAYFVVALVGPGLVPRVADALSDTLWPWLLGGLLLSVVGIAVATRIGAGLLGGSAIAVVPALTGGVFGPHVAIVTAGETLRPVVRPQERIVLVSLVFVTVLLLAFGIVFGVAWRRRSIASGPRSADGRPKDAGDPRDVGHPEDTGDPEGVSRPDDADGPGDAGGTEPEPVLVTVGTAPGSGEDAGSRVASGGPAGASRYAVELVGSNRAAAERYLLLVVCAPLLFAVGPLVESVVGPIAVVEGLVGCGLVWAGAIGARYGWPVDVVETLLVLGGLAAAAGLEPDGAWIGNGNGSLPMLFSIAIATAVLVLAAFAGYRDTGAYVAGVTGAVGGALAGVLPQTSMGLILESAALSLWTLVFLLLSVPLGLVGYCFGVSLRALVAPPVRPGTRSTRTRPRDRPVDRDGVTDRSEPE